MKSTLIEIQELCHEIAIKEGNPTWKDLAQINDKVEALAEELQQPKQITQECIDHFKNSYGSRCETIKWLLDKFLGVSEK